MVLSHARIQKIFSGGVQIPRRGLTENFNMAKTNNLAIPVGGGGGGPDPLSSPLDPPIKCYIDMCFSSSVHGPRSVFSMVLNSYKTFV